MCLVTNQKNPIVLESDIIVYKKMGSIQDQYAQSMLFPFIYEYNVKYGTNLRSHLGFREGDTFFDYHVEKRYSLNTIPDRENDENLVIISQGFHWFTSKDRLDDFGRGTYDESKIVKCIIPAGAQIFFDDTGLGVSDKIIVLKP